MMNLTTPVLLLASSVTGFSQKLPTAALLSTGGTIASKQDPAKGGYAPGLSREDLVSAVPAIKKIAQIQAEQISNIPSRSRRRGRCSFLSRSAQAANLPDRGGNPTLTC